MDYKEKYEQALERAKDNYNAADSANINVNSFKNTLIAIFPELRKSEDERIRKKIIKILKGETTYTSNENTEEYVAWLEKQVSPDMVADAYLRGCNDTEKKWREKQSDNNNQNWKISKEQIHALEHFVRGIAESGYASPYDDNTKLLKSLINDLHKHEKQGDQDNNEDVDVLQRFSFYSYKDEPNVLYLSGLYVNEEYRNKGIGTKILKIANEVSTMMECNYIRLKAESGSDAERLYKENGYNTLKKEGNQVWLEKQGEQKPQGKTALEAAKEEKVDNANKVEPKFKVGDWVVYDHKPYQVVELPKKGYINLGLKGNGKIEFAPSTYCRNWTIKDANDGDVLSYENEIFIVKKSVNTNILYYCCYDRKHFIIDSFYSLTIDDIDNIRPATKEQRDQLEKAMTDAGYKWNKEQLKLEKT